MGKEIDHSTNPIPAIHVVEEPFFCLSNGFPADFHFSPDPQDPQIDIFLNGYYNSVINHLLEEGFMRVANTVELKNSTNKILKEVMKGSPVIITYRGKPAASLTPLTQDDLEDFILENSPVVRRMIAEAEKDIRRGKVVSLDQYLTKAHE